MVAFMRNLLGRRLLPAEFASFAVEAEDDELVIVVWSGGLLLEARVGLRQIGRIGDAIGLDRRGKEHPIAPDDRRGTAAARERGLPFNVLVLIPVDGRVGFRSGAVGLRA